jgi:hypothetical protein
MAKPNYSQNMFLLILIIVSIITYLIVLSLSNPPDKKKSEGFCDSSNCSVCLCNGIGQEICNNRNNKIIAYNNGVTENSIPNNGVPPPLFAPYL